MAFFQMTCYLLLFLLDLWCGLLHPVYETLFYLKYQ